MAKTAFIFSGQGAQYPGMGRDLYSGSNAAKAVMDGFEGLRPGTLDLCFSGSKEALRQTVNTQPCLYAVALGAAAALNELGVKADICAGFSLGELCALAYGGVFSAEDGFSLVCERARLMDEAATGSDCCMGAVVRLSAGETLTLCAQFEGIYPVNFNAPQQTVVALKEKDFQAFGAAVSAAGGRVVKLDVSGGFHSPYMDVPAAAFARTLAAFPLCAPRLPVYADMTGGLYPQDADGIKSLLSRQINHPVLWETVVKSMANSGADTFIEIGAGKTLAGLVAKILPSAAVFSVDNTENARAVCAFIEEKNHA